MFGIHRTLRAPTSLAITIWLFAVGAGLFLLSEYELTAGASGIQSDAWPAASGIRRNIGGAHLIMFAHPRCPCTRASLGELARIMTECQGLVTAEVLFLKPRGVGEDWDNTDLWRAAGAIPGVRAVADEGGRERERFGIETSGHVLMYNAAGKLVFSGGITPSRGQSGENAGRAELVRFVRQGGRTRAETPVFGCPLSSR